MGPHPGPELEESKCICASVHDDDLFESLILIWLQMLTLIRNYLLHAHINQAIHTHFIHMYIACHHVMPLDLYAEKKRTA